MSDLDLPEDLIQLQRTIDAARRAADEYVAAVEAERAAAPPRAPREDGEPWARPAWAVEPS